MATDTTQQRQFKFARSGWASRGRRRNISRVVATILTIIGAAIILFPIVWMVSASLKQSSTDVLTFPPQLWVSNPRWQNYGDALFGKVPIFQYMLNTAVYTTIAVVGEVLSSSLVAFGFARLRAPGKSFLFLLLISTMLMPYQVTMIPRFVMFTQVQDVLRSIFSPDLKVIDTYWPLLVPKFFGSAYLIFLVRQFYLGIPNEMVEAARIDGCSFFGVWWRIVTPLSRPILTAVGLLSFMYHWNNYLEPLIYISDPEKLTLAQGLANFRGTYIGQTPLHVLMAATLVAVLPCVVIFFVTNRYFVQGVVISGVKG